VEVMRPGRLSRPHSTWTMNAWAPLTGKFPGPMDNAAGADTAYRKTCLPLGRMPSAMASPHLSLMPFGSATSPTDHALNPDKTWVLSV
jgi:hypothetical protein